MIDSFKKFMDQVSGNLNAVNIGPQNQQVFTSHSGTGTVVIPHQLEPELTPKELEILKEDYITRKKDIF